MNILKWVNILKILPSIEYRKLWCEMFQVFTVNTFYVPTYLYNYIQQQKNLNR